MAVTADGCEAGVVVSDGDVEDLVAVRGVGLDEARFGLGGMGFGRVVKVDGAVGGTGENLK